MDREDGPKGMTSPEPLDFVILGAQKSGTTTLHEVMRHHPGLSMPPGKEAPIFNQEGISPEAIRAQIAALFGPTPGLRGKATPQYLSSLQARTNLARLAPHARLIVILRDPVERCFSQYRMIARRTGMTRPFPDLLDTWLTDAALTAARQREHRLNEDELPFCVVWSEYGRMMAGYLGAFPREQVLILWLDDLALAPHQTFRRIFRFLGVDPDWTNAAIGEAFHRGGDRAIVDLDKIRRIPALGPALRWVHGRLGADLRMRINTRNIRPTAKSARTLHPDAARRLDAHFAADQALLRRVLGEPEPPPAPEGDRP